MVRGSRRSRPCGDAAPPACRAVAASPGMRTASGWTGLARPVLRGGLHVVRRDDLHLQIGLDEPDRLVLRDQPGLLDALSALERTPPPELRPVLDRLVADGWVVDAAEPRRRVRVLAERRPPVALEVDALGARRGDPGVRGRRPAGRRSRRPRRSCVTLGEPRRRGLRRAGARRRRPTCGWRCCPRRCGSGRSSSPAARRACAASTPISGSATRRRATVLHQLDELPVAPYAGGTRACSTSASRGRSATSVRRLDGELPALRSATVTVTADLEVTRHDWLRHPHCGCAWG